MGSKGQGHVKDSMLVSNLLKQIDNGSVHHNKKHCSDQVCLGDKGCGFEHVEFEVTLKEQNRKVSGQLEIEVQSFLSFAGELRSFGFQMVNKALGTNEITYNRRQLEECLGHSLERVEHSRTRLKKYLEPKLHRSQENIIKRDVVNKVDCS